MENNKSRTYTFKQENGEDKEMTFTLEHGTNIQIDSIEFLVQRVLKLEEEVKNLKNK